MFINPELGDWVRKLIGPDLQRFLVYLPFFSILAVEGVEKLQRIVDQITLPVDTSNLSLEEQFTIKLGLIYEHFTWRNWFFELNGELDDSFLNVLAKDWEETMGHWIFTDEEHIDPIFKDRLPQF